MRTCIKLALAAALGLTVTACVAYAPAPGYPVYGYGPAYYGPTVAVGYGGYYHGGGYWRR